MRYLAWEDWLPSKMADDLGRHESMADVTADGRTPQVLGVGRFLRSIEPELVSSSSDNDPTNVGTAVAVGAQTGFQLAWVTLLVAPLLGIVQTIAAHVGLVARNDLQTLTRRRYGQGVAAILLVSIVVVNVVTIAADLQAGAAGIGILAGVDTRWLVLPLSACCWLASTTRWWACCGNPAC